MNKPQNQLREPHDLPDASEARAEILQRAREDYAKVSTSVRKALRMRGSISRALTGRMVELGELIDDIVEHEQIEGETRLVREANCAMSSKRRSP